MNEFTSSLQNSGINRFWSSLAPSTRAALALALPYTLVDAVHYYTAGSALVFSLPILIILYLWCGALAARFSSAGGHAADQWPTHGFKAGITLWLISTLVNALIAVLVGVASLGLTLALGVPYLLLCGPVFLVISGLGGWLGARGYGAVSRRIEKDDEFSSVDDV